MTRKPDTFALVGVTRAPEVLGEYRVGRLLDLEEEGVVLIATVEQRDEVTRSDAAPSSVAGRAAGSRGSRATCLV